MPFNFPTNPAVGQQSTQNGRVYAWNGTVWQIATTSVSGSDAPNDGTTYGRKNGLWVDITSPANLQVRRGTAAEVAAITPLEGEPVWATDTKVLTIGDGSTAGGILAGHPVRVSRSTGDGNLAQLTNSPARNQVTLSPQGSVWEFFWMTYLGPGGSDYADNATMTFIPNTTNTSGLIGEFLFINSNGSSKHARLGGGIDCDVTGAGEYMSARGVVEVATSPATLDFIVVPSDVQTGGQAGPSICIARRIA